MIVLLLTSNLKNGTVIGLLKRWDDEDRKVAEECEYFDGELHGYRKLYFYDPNVVKYTNIEQWENGVHIKDIQIESQKNNQTCLSAYGWPRITFKTK